MVLRRHGSNHGIWGISLPVDGFWRNRMKAGFLLTILIISACPCALALPPVKSPAASTQAVSASASNRSITASSRSKVATTGATSSQAGSKLLTTKFLQFSVHHKLFGDGTMLIGPKQLLFHVLHSDLQFCMTAPYKKVTTFCKETGKYIEVDPRHFVNPYTKSRAIISGVVYKDIPMQKTGQAYLLGTSTDIYQTPQSYTNEMRVKVSRREISDSQPAKCKGNYLTFNADPTVIKLASDILASPEVQGKICLKLDIEELGADKVPFIDTSKISAIKNSEQVMTLFEVPKGLKKVKNTEEVIQNESAGDAIKMMLEGGNHDNYK